MYIDRPADASEGGRARLAAALASRFGLPQARLLEHLAAGRLRVKANTDEATARARVAQLKALGAVASMDASSPIPPPPSSSPIPPPSPSPPASKSTPSYESGLAAAFRGSSGARQVDLGALGHVDPSAEAPPPLKLGALDGTDAEPPPPPPVPRPAAPPPARPLDVGVKPLPTGVGAKDDPFAPPSVEDAPLELAASPAKPKAKVKTIADVAEPVVAPAASPAPSSSSSSAPARREAAAVPPAPSPVPAVHSPHPASSETMRPPPIVTGGPFARLFAGRPRQRFLAGLFLSLLLGFGAAHVYASSAEDRYAEIRRAGETEAPPANMEEYETAVEARKDTLASLSSAHTRITVSAAVLWLLVGAAFGYLFFRFLA